jgi:hypothetical protein
MTEEGSAPIPVYGNVERKVKVSSHFKMVFLTVAGITISFFVANLAIVIFVKEPGERLDAFINTTTALYQAGFGAMVGLIGGKAS